MDAVAALFPTAIEGGSGRNGKVGHRGRAGRQQIVIAHPANDAAKRHPDRFGALWQVAEKLIQPGGQPCSITVGAGHIDPVIDPRGAVNDPSMPAIGSGNAAGPVVIRCGTARAREGMKVIEGRHSLLLP